MTDPGDRSEEGNDDPRIEGPPDPNLDPARSPGLGEDIQGLEDIEVSRDDIVIGEADPADFTAADTDPVADDDIASLIDDLANGSPKDRQRAAIALSDRAPDEAVLEVLAASARSDPDADVRQFSVEALADLGSPDAARVALAALDDDDPWVRAEAVVALDSLGRDQFAHEIEDALDDDHHAVRRNALVSLWKLRGTDVADTLYEFVDDESDRVREWVASLLAEIDDQRAESALETLAEDDHDIVAQTANAALEDADGGSRALYDRSATQYGRPEESRHDTPPDL